MTEPGQNKDIIFINNNYLLRANADKKPYSTNWGYNVAAHGNVLWAGCEQESTKKEQQMRD